jgi:transcriptional regulator with PAS, ATPase and Fis domain
MNGLLITVRNALETIALKKENRLLQEKYVKQNLPRIVGESRVIQEILKEVRQVAQSSDTPVLLYGETGTGKELIAQTIHYLSPNYKGNLVSVNCAAIPKQLIESELFGYERGAFSGAEKSGKIGLVEKAAEGTLFFDEVGDMGSEVQAKLLRFLESGEYFRVGGSKSRRVKTRVVSATNKNLATLVKQGEFRSDLYFRLAVVRIEIPPLSRRPEDILALSRFFLNDFNDKFNKAFHGFSPDAEAALVQREWTGNVRELRNFIERAVLFGNGGILSREDLGLDGAVGTSTRCRAASSSLIPELSAEGIDLPQLVKQIEDRFFNQALALCKGNVTRAAKLLHMSRDQFRYRVQKSQP